MLSNDNDLCIFCQIYERTSWGSRQTRHGELVHFGGPIIIEKLLNADLFGGLGLFRPGSMAALYLNIHVHLGCRRNISIYTKSPSIARYGETKDIRALDWCPGSVVCLL